MPIFALNEARSWDQARRRDEAAEAYARAARGFLAQEAPDDLEECLRRLKTLCPRADSTAALEGKVLYRDGRKPGGADIPAAGRQGHGGFRGPIPPGADPLGAGGADGGGGTPAEGLPPGGGLPPLLVPPGRGSLPLRGPRGGRGALGEGPGARPRGWLDPEPGGSPGGTPGRRPGSRGSLPGRPGAAPGPGRTCGEPLRGPGRRG
ncbi:MAG: hypothetical protein MZV63_57505 [Marinilabiliales bacterium]|nr:hypothetical protein [Marinilabiliales bacterium]